MSIRTRLLSAAAATALLAVLILTSVYGNSSREQAGSLLSGRTTIRFWYNDSAMTGYFNDVSVAFNSTQNLYRVEPKLISDNAYLDRIYKASLEGEDFPDLYLISHDALERCWKTGLASEIMDEGHFSDTSYFPQSALDAVTYKGKKIAYPLCFETSALLYNTDYTDFDSDREGSVPGTVLDIIQFANDYDAPEQVSAVFKWDVSDIFYNYGFVGNYIQVGGPCGDDADQLDLYNQQAITCLQVYQQLNQFFSIDSESDDYESVIRDFADGRTVFTIATTDAVAVLREQTESGNEIHYAVAGIPDSTSELLARPMSVTDCLVVNGFGEEQEKANAFIRFLLYEQLSDFYDRTGRAPAIRGYNFSDPHMEGFFASYEESVPITKLRVASNFWMLMENTFARVWNGADANESLHVLTQQIMTQITGNDEEEVEKLPDLVPIDISAELEGMD